MMACLQSFAKAQNITLTHAVDGQDVAEIMLALIDEEKSKLWKEGDEAKESSMSEEQEECEVSEIVESKTVVGVAEQQSQTAAMEVDSQEEKEVTSKKRKAVVEVEEQQSDTAAIQEGKEVRLKKRKTVVVKVEEEQRDTAAIAVERQEESEEIEESEESADEQEPEDSKAEETPAANTKPLSHHVNRKCVVGHHCLYEGPNLKRHLRNFHVKNAHIEDSQVERYFALGLGSHNIRGPPEKTKSGKKNRGRWKRWCPQPNCNYLGVYLPHHLQNKHRMKPSSTLYKNCLKNAVKYKGLDEELEEMAKPSGKRARADESNEDSDGEDIIPPTPAKRKAASSVLPAKTKAKAPSASNTSAAPSVTSKSSFKTSMAPTVTSEASNPKKSKPLQTTAPPVTSEAPNPKKSNTSQSSKPSDALPCQSTLVQS